MFVDSNRQISVQHVASYIIDDLGKKGMKLNTNKDLPIFELVIQHEILQLTSFSV